LQEKQYAIDTMDCGVMTIAPNGAVTYCNPVAERFFHIEPDKCVTFQEIVSVHGKMNDAFIDLVIEAIMHKEQKRSGSVEVVSAAEGIKWIYVTCTRMLNGNTVVTFVDQTDLHLQEKKTRDSVLILTAILFMGCLWAVLVSFWQHTNRPWTVGLFTIAIEILGFLALGMIVSKTKMKLMDLGLSLRNIRKTAVSTLIRAACLLLFFCAVKLIILKVKPGFFPDGAPFWDWRQADHRLVKYFFTAFFQELLSRGGIQECLTRIMPGKKSEYYAIALSSLFFMAVHVQNGFFFSLGSGILSVILGLIYKKDRNVYGVTVIHYLFGKLADFLRFTSQ